MKEEIKNIREDNNIIKDDIYEMKIMMKDMMGMMKELMADKLRTNRRPRSNVSPTDKSPERKISKS